MTAELPPAARAFVAPSISRSAVQTFAGDFAVVTGGGTGLGLELSRGLAALGARVAILSRNPEHHREFLDECAARGWRGEALALDLREPVEVERAANALAEKHGAPTILVNNAAGNFVCPAERLSSRAWRAVLGIVLDGTFYASRYFGRHMLDARRGQILNVVATYAWTGMPGVVHSASAKAGVLAMTRTLAVEWARYGVRVNAIAPGPFESRGAHANLWPDDAMRTRIEAGIPLKRFGTAEEMAAHCLWLLSPASSYVNGECFTIDGGASLGRGMWEEGATRRGSSDSSKEGGA
ncbi:MAG: SDR family oxidoreductase [Planctomycetes bacterium]|nr:SDR family oxidoreductase [Planctomycetota bacterium]